MNVNQSFLKFFTSCVLFLFRLVALCIFSLVAVSSSTIRRKMSFFKNWGCYPPEYNREVHGPYNPGVYYGKPDTKFGDVKLKDLIAWIGRRKKTPRAVAQAISRAWMRYQINWVYVKQPKVYFLHHLTICAFLTSWYLNYGYRKHFQYFRFH